DNGWNGSFGKCEIYIADTTDGFDQPAAKTAFRRKRISQSVTFKPVPGRFILVRVLSEVNGNAWASAAEIGIAGTPIR
ncbi:MAG: hypothetical protein VB858_18240, partial [Planctomycetaceae bacterium]